MKRDFVLALWQIGEAWEKFARSWWSRAFLQNKETNPNRRTSQMNCHLIDKGLFTMTFAPPSHSFVGYRKGYNPRYNKKCYSIVFDGLAKHAFRNLNRISIKLMKLMNYLQSFSLHLKFSQSWRTQVVGQFRKF